MTRTVQMVLQLFAAFIQIVVTQIPDIPANWTPAIHGLVAFCQVAIAIVGHSYNPDGTSAAVGYQKEKP